MTKILEVQKDGNRTLILGKGHAIVGDQFVVVLSEAERAKLIRELTASCFDFVLSSEMMEVLKGAPYEHGKRFTKLHT